MNALLKFIFLSTSFCFSAFAQESENIFSIEDVFLQAEKNDPVYRQAREDYNATREELPQSIANYLPQLSATGTVLKNHSNVKANGGALFGLGRHRYRSEDYSLNLSQSIFNYQELMLINKAKASVKQAYYQYKAAYQDLIMRTVKAYAAILEAQEELKFAKIQEKASLTRFLQAKDRLKVGLVAQTVVYDAESAYDLAAALVISKENNILNLREELRKITNIYPKSLVSFKNNIPLISTKPNDIKYWESFAIQNNVGLRSSQYATLAAKEGIEVQKGLNFPVLNAIASVTKSKIGSQGAGPINNTVRGAGVEFTIPIFEGGGNLSLIRQAQYVYESAFAQEETTRRQVINDVRQAYLGLESGIQQIKADAQAIKSSESALKSTEASYRVGISTILDVQTAQANLFSAQVTHAQDQYAYILNQVALKEAAGTLSINDLEKISLWLDDKSS